MAKTISTIAERNIAAEDDILSISESESESRKVSFSTCTISVSSTNLRDVAAEPRIIIMFISLPGSSRSQQGGRRHIIGIIGSDEANTAWLTIAPRDWANIKQAQSFSRCANGNNTY